MKEVVVMVGAPGSGKSTRAKILMKGGKYKIVSFDEIRKEWYGDISIQGDSKAVVEEGYKRAKDYLDKNYHVIFDATNTIKRYKAVRRFREYGATVVRAVYMNTSLEVCLERNKVRKDRNTPVPELVVKKMYRRLKSGESSLFDKDGFDTVEIVNNGNTYLL